VHWQSDRWIDVQLSYLARNLTLPTRTYACLNEIDPSHNAKFSVVCELEGSHPAKLNELARRVTAEADPNDILLFLDGDAFPIAPLDGWIERTLDRYPLAAVRRDENNGDRQPHPCFCVTTVQFWNDIDGDWHRGEHTWLDRDGRPAGDVGGKVLLELEQRGIEWLPLLRSNVSDRHPVLFGVYGNLVYHHGAGFRLPIVRATNRGGLLELRPDQVSAHALLPSAVKRVLARPWRWARARSRESAARRAALEADRVFERIQRDPHFFYEFTGGPIASTGARH
jgi:hypothetical protein